MKNRFTRVKPITLEVNFRPSVRLLGTKIERRNNSYENLNLFDANNHYILYDKNNFISLLLLNVQNNLKIKIIKLFL